MAQSVSVIIPSLNSPLISEVVATVWAQQLHGWSLEVIVSGIDQPNAVPKTGARLVSTGETVSAAIARNRGVRESTADYIIFLDSDCLPQAGWLTALLVDIQERYNVAGGAIRIVPDQYVRLAGNLASFHEFTTALPREERPFLASFSLALSRQAFEAIGGFDERFPISGGEDLDFTIRLRKAGYRLWFDPSAAVVHRPDRSTLAKIWRHGFQAGRNSIWVRRNYPEAFGMPSILFRWPILLCGAPGLVLVVAARALARNRDVRAHWPALPVLLASRLAWCMGACQTLRRGSPWSPLDQAVALPHDGAPE